MKQHIKPYWLTLLQTQLYTRIAGDQTCKVLWQTSAAYSAAVLFFTLGKFGIVASDSPGSSIVPAVSLSSNLGQCVHQCHLIFVFDVSGFAVPPSPPLHPCFPLALRVPEGLVSPVGRFPIQVAVKLFSASLTAFTKHNEPVCSAVDKPHPSESERQRQTGGGTGIEEGVDK